MGDRCYLRITVEKARIDDFDKIMFGSMGGGPVPEEEDDFTVTYEMHEVNYAAYSEREEAAQAGILFYGYNGSGSEYPSALFCNADKRSAEWPVGGSYDRYILYADENGEVDPNDQEEVKRFAADLAHTKSIMHNPLHRLVAAT